MTRPNIDTASREAPAEDVVRQGIAEASAAAGAGTTAARSVLRMAQHGATAMGEAQRELGVGTAEGLVAINRALGDLFREQSRQNLELWTHLARSLRWEMVIKPADVQELTDLQARCWRESLDWTMQLTRRYADLGRTMAAAMSTQERDSDRAA